MASNAPTQDDAKSSDPISDPIKQPGQYELYSDQVQERLAAGHDLDGTGEIVIFEDFKTSTGEKFTLTTNQLGADAISKAKKVDDWWTEMNSKFKLLDEEEQKLLDWELPQILADLSPAEWERLYPKPELFSHGKGDREKFYLTAKRGKELSASAAEVRQLQKTMWHAQQSIQLKVNAFWKRKQTIEKQEELKERFRDIKAPIVPSYALNEQGTDAAAATAEDKVIASKAKIIDEILDSNEIKSQNMDEWKSVVLERIEKASAKYQSDIEIIEKMNDLKIKIQNMKPGWFNKKIDPQFTADCKADFLAGEGELDSSDVYLTTIRKIVIKIMEGSLDFMLINNEPYSKKVYQAEYNEAFKNKENTLTSQETILLRKSNDDKILAEWTLWCKKYVRPHLEQGTEPDVVWSIIEQFPWKMPNGDYYLDMTLDTKEDCDHVEDVLYRFHKAYLLPLNLRSLDIRGVWGAMRGDIMATMYSRLDMMLPYIAVATSVQQIGNMSRTGNNLTNLYAGVHAKVAGRWIQISAHMLIAALSPDEVSDYNTMNVVLTWFARFSDQSAWGSAGVPLSTQSVMEVPQDHIDLLVSRLPLAGDQRSRAQKKFNEQKDAWVKAVHSYTTSAKAIANTVVRVLSKLKSDRN